MFINRSFIEMLAAAVLAAVMFLLSLPLQSLGSLLAFLAPVPVTLSTCRHGRGAGFLALLLSAALVMPFLELPAILSFAFGVAAMGWILGCFLSAGAGLIISAAVTSAAVILLSAGASLLFLVAAGLEPGTFFGYQVGEVLRETEFILQEIARSSEGLRPEDLQPFLSFFRKTLPATLTVTVFLQALASGYLALRILNRLRPRRWALSGAASFALPEEVIWFLIASLALLWAPVAGLGAAALNVAVILLLAYLIQGLSVLVHILQRLGASRPLRMILIIIALLQPYLLAIPLAAGLLDFKFDWRSKWPLDAKP